MYFSAGHYRQPLAFTTSAGGHATTARRIREAGRRLAAGDSPEEMAAHRDAFFDALADDFNTAEALAPLFDWIERGEPRPASGAATCGRCSACSGSRRWSRTRTPAATRRARWSSSARRRARRATSRRPTGCATSCARAARRCATARRGPSSSGLLSAPPPRSRPPSAAPPPAAAPAPRGANVLYGRNAVHEALRGRRRVHGSGRPSGGRRGLARRPAGARGRRSSALRLARPPGRLRPSRPVPVRRRGRAARRPDPLLVALDEVQDPQNLGAVCRTAEAAGATGVLVPERRSAEVTAAVARRRPAPSSTCPSPWSATSPTCSARPAAGCWVYGAAAGAPTAYDAPSTGGGIVLVLGAEGRGLRPRVAASCDDLVSLPLRGRIGSLNVSATAAVLLYAPCSRGLTRLHKRATLRVTQVELEGIDGPQQ